MTWYVILLRNGKDLLVEGEVERDRIMRRKVPKALSWSPARIHTCSICGNSGPWTDEWMWWGSYADLDDGKDIIKLCSPACRDRHGRPKREERKPGQAWNEVKVAERHEALPATERREVFQNRYERERNAKKHRKFSYVDRSDGPGGCRWCGKVILETRGKNAGIRSKRHRWHRECYGEYLLHTDRGVQAVHLMERDGSGCALCPRPSGKWISGGTVFHDQRREKGFSRIGWSVPLEVDHVVPLWKVPADAPAETVQAMHGPDNLWLLCHFHHRWKSALEAKERAALR